MLDVLLTIAVAATQLVLGVRGIMVALKPPEDKRQHKWWITGFIVVGLLGIGATVWLSHSANKANEQIRRELDQTRLSQQHTKGQLDSIALMLGRIGEVEQNPSLAKLAAAISDMAKANLRNSLDIKSTNSEIAFRALNLAKEIRRFESDYQEHAEAMRAQQQELVAAATTIDKRHDPAQEQFVQQEKSWQDHDLDFRDKYFGDAKYLADSMLQRLPPDKASLLRDANRHADTFLANGQVGGFENGFAAYLEELAKALLARKN